MRTKTLLLSAGAALALLAALLGFSAADGPPARAGAPSPAVSVQPPSLDVDYADGAFEVSIKLNDLHHQGQLGYDDNDDTVPDRFEPSTGLGAFEFTLFFDPALLRIIGAEPRDFLASTGRSIFCFQRWPEPGEYSFGCASSGSEDGPQGGGELAVVTIEPVANGTSALNLEAGLAGPLGDDIPTAAYGGTVRITGAPEPPPPTATPTPRPTPTQTSPGGGGDHGPGNDGGSGDNGTRGGGIGDGGGSEVLGGGTGGAPTGSSVVGLPATGGAGARGPNGAAPVAAALVLFGAAALAAGVTLARLRLARS